MTELDLLKRVRDDVPPPAPLVLARARQQLFTPPPVRRRATRPRLLVAGALGLTLAGGFLAADVVRHDSSPLPGTVADASTFLAYAAAQTNGNPDTPIPPGQYRQITVKEGRLINLGSTPSLRASLQDRTDTWVPADQNRRFVTRYDRSDKVEFASPEAQELARARRPDLFFPSKPSSSLSTCPGVFDGGVTRTTFPPSPPCQPSWRQPSRAFLAALPRDPDALLATLRKNPPKHLPADYEAWSRIGTVLGTGAVPADLRAALYQAARKIPGIRLLDEEVITVDGQRARAISRETADTRYDLLISPSTGQYLGRRAVITKDGPADINGNPDRTYQRGDIYSWSTLTTQLTPTQPAATSPPARSESYGR
ncbi:CU044_5270 family protein [Kribbella sp. NPDC056861]|uniref:CU044_5270 family protein n=1 Tax=Kribbella sp. NPDC056861 TaxID=3154857 RepID=UPI00341E2120